MSTLAALRNSIMTSIHGRRLGLAPNETLVGPPDIAVPTIALTSDSSGTAILPYGIHSIDATTLTTATWLLSNPIPGVSVTVRVGDTQNASTVVSSGVKLLRPSTAFYISSSKGSTFVGVLLSSRATVTLTGITTALYGVTARSLSTAVVEQASS